ncbi:MAG TPA: GNAT family N-acetyltransferase [Bacteroidales bacterium]|nr:GNAT family N-acetyltransferase [Bacteroidales bacterium]
MIEIRVITISGLRDFIESPEYKTMPVIPVSRHRAISHTRNPMAAGDDRILFLAYDENRFVGYLGAMPDELVTGDKRVKVAWLSCMWVDASQRGKGIAPMLMLHAHQAWGGNLLITNFIPIAKKAYDKTGLFTEFKSLPGVRGYLRFNLTGILIAKKPGLKTIKWLLRIVDRSLNILNEVRLIRWYLRFNLKHVIFEYVNDIDDETMTLIAEKSKLHLSPKNSEHLQWLVHYPWILNRPFKDLNSLRYAFSACINGFNQHYIKLYDSSYKLIAFMILTYREAHLKTPYIFCDEADAEQVMKLIFAHALKLGVRTISTYHPLLAANILSSANPFILTRKMNYRFLISKELLEKLGDTKDLIFQEGDGDAAFV